MQNFTQQVEVYLGRHMSPQARSRALAIHARTGLSKLMRSGRVSRHYTTFVDGIEGANEDSVRPNGVIMYRFTQAGQIVLEALDFLRANSPVASGRYRDSFVVGIGDRIIEAGALNWRNLEGGPEIFITNKQPYNRKVDVQLAGNKRLTFEGAEQFIYQRCVKHLRALFGVRIYVVRNYNIRYPNKWILRRGRNAGKPVESPGIIISLE